MRKPNIDWDYSGPPDPMAGTGATVVERGLVWATGAVAAGLMVYFGEGGWIHWEWWQTGLAALIAFDIVGGALASSLNSAKRFYFAPVKPEERGVIGLLKTGLYLPAVHVHPMLVYLVYKPLEFWTGIIIYLGVAGAAILVRFAPLYLARPLAMLFVIVAIIVNIYVLRPVAGFEWLLPLLTLKLVLGYACREEPYRPG